MIEFPAFDASASGSSLMEFKELDEARLWIDKIYVTVDLNLQYRVDQNPCVYDWFQWQECVARNTCEIADITQDCYPPITLREGYVLPRSISKPKAVCVGTSKRLSTWGFTFQPILTVKGWCRIRGLQLDFLTREKPPWFGMKC